MTCVDDITEDDRHDGESVVRDLQLNIDGLEIQQRHEASDKREGRTTLTGYEEEVAPQFATNQQKLQVQRLQDIIVELNKKIDDQYVLIYQSQLENKHLKDQAEFKELNHCDATT